MPNFPHSEVIPLFQDALAEEVQATFPDHIRSKFGPGVEAWHLHFSETGVTLVITYKDTDAG